MRLLRNSLESAIEMKITVEKINKVLDLVSSVDPRDNTRWGHDTDCGDNDYIVAQAWVILEAKE